MPMTMEKQQAGGLGLDDKGSMGYVYLICMVAAVGGLLFGYDTAVISGAIGFMEKQFQLDPTQKGWVASCALIGCAVGASFAGWLSDKFGRKKVLILSAIFFGVSAVGAAIPRTPTEFVFARLIGGLGIGIASMLAPMYIAEVAPARVRGSLVSLNQMAIITGILIAAVVDWLCAKYLTPEMAWRWMFGMCAAPSVVFLFLLTLVPESPRWLAKQGQTALALSILTRVGGRSHAEAEMNEISTTIKQEGGSIFQLFHPGLRIALLIGVALAVFQQITGINSVLYYGPEIFKQAGFAAGDAFLSNIYVGAINAVFTVLAILLVDKLGRKPLLLIGALGMGVSIAMAGHSFHVLETILPIGKVATTPAQMAQVHAISSKILFWVLAYVASFALTLGPVVWVVMSEIFPTKIRGRAMSISTVLLWVSCYGVSQSFPMLVDKMGKSFPYYLYAGVCLVMFVFVLIVIPETKGKTLEEIEKRWVR